VGHDLGPIIAVIAFMSVPVIAILTRHQQKMARIFQEGHRNQGQDAHVRQELAELRNLVAQQTIALDSMAQTQRALAARISSESDEVQRRLNVRG